MEETKKEKDLKNWSNMHKQKWHDFPEKINAWSHSNISTDQWQFLYFIYLWKLFFWKQYCVWSGWFNCSSTQLTLFFVKPPDAPSPAAILSFFSNCKDFTTKVSLHANTVIRRCQRWKKEIKLQKNNV